MNIAKESYSVDFKSRIRAWLEPELFQPFLVGLLGCLTVSEFVRGALTLSLLPLYGRTSLLFAVAWTTLAISVQAAVDNVFRSVVGILIDKYGQRPLLIIGFCLSTTAVLVMMHVRSVPGLLAAAALYGMGVTPVWPAAISGIGLATPETKRASFMGYLYMAWLAGMGLGPVIINFLIGRTYRGAFWLLAGIEFLGLCLAILLTKRQPSRGGDRSSSLAVSTQSNHDLAHLANHRRDPDYWWNVIGNVRNVAYLFPGMFVQTFAVALLTPILSLYARMVLHISPVAFSSVLVVGGAVAAATLIPAGKVVDKVGATRLLVPAFFVVGACLLSLPTFTVPSWPYIVISVLGFSYAFVLPSWNAVLDGAIDPDKKATLWGVFMTVEGLGTTLGPTVGGLVWDTFGPTAPFHVSGGVILLMGLLYLLLPIGAPHRQESNPPERRMPTEA